MLYQALAAVRAEFTGPGGPFEVQEIEVRGAPMRVYKHAPPNVRAIWLATAPFADREYLVFEGERLTYAQAHAITASVANWLFDQGVQPGDRVAIAMRNYPEWMLIYWACLSAGVTVVGLNAWWVADELEYALQDSAPKVAFCDAERLNLVLGRPAASPGPKLVAVRADAASAGVVDWSEVVARGGSMPDVDVGPDEDACIFYTSGTTGRPKGAQLTHRGCAVNLLNAMYSSQSQAAALERAAGVKPQVVTPSVLIGTPLFHVSANNCSAYTTTAAGGKLVLMRRWDPAEALTLMEQERITQVSCVPVMTRELLNHPDFHRRDTTSLLVLGGGGAPLQPDLVAKIDGETGPVRPSTGYGLTETSGIITSVIGRCFTGKPTSVGPVMPSFEAKCVDDDGQAVGVGETGELWVRGSPVIKGYINRPEATAEAITDGWFHTGDIARIDEDGFVYIVDRKKDMVLRGGENVYCAEVEACFYRHPAVAECCVFGVPDARMGEEVGAAVVLRPGETPSADELRAHCATSIARHKIPRYLWLLREPIPRNASGKFMKGQLRESLAVDEAA